MEQPPVILSLMDDDIAKEKGRLWAAQAIAQNPEQMKRVEDALGIAYCKRRWPEAYSSSVFPNIIDQIQFKTP